jgi:hypothetical protein
MATGKTAREITMKLSLHDGELVGVSIDRNRALARLDFRMENGVLRIAEFRGLKAFRSEDLIMQNVVSRVLQFSLGEIDVVEHWFIWATSFSDGSSWLDKQKKYEWLNKCTEGILDIVVIEPSCGATFVGLCEQFVITEQ